MYFLMLLQKMLGKAQTSNRLPPDGGDEDEVDELEAVRVVLFMDIFECVANKKHSVQFLTEKWTMLQKTLSCVVL